LKHGTCDEDIQNTITMEKNSTKTTKALRGIPWYKNIDKKIKENIFHGAVLLYGGKM
jgi:hypothetical protein